MSDLEARLRTALADRYHVDREIGRGGMARVFRAHDLRLDRPIALKTLPPDVAAVAGGERFRREIMLAAKLEHPHILPVHDCGEADGILYYVMPYVEGESLRARLSREKQLPLEDALRLTREVADALSHAHSHGVIHRDIKPENILLESGHAVVADFGIARAIDAARGEQLTEAGVALGTPAYMSPEQLSGVLELDGRSDLYSLGCVLYEMLGGQPPFTGRTADSLRHQHLAAPVPAITLIRPSVPEWVAAALERSLAKTPADRFRTLAQFGEAITPRVSTAEVRRGARPPWRTWLRWAAGLLPALALIIWLAVWGPLGTLLGNRANTDAAPTRRPWVIVADFAGTAEPTYRRTTRDLVAAALDQSVVAATLPFEQIRRGLELAGKPETTTVTEAVARELAVRAGIATVVTGQVDRVGSAYAVLLRLVQAGSGEVLIAEQQSAANDDALIPTLEAGSRALLGRLGERRGALEARAPMPEVMTSSFAAYQLYAAAERLDQHEGRRREARDLLRQAVTLDPDFASAWLLLWRLGGGRTALEEARRRPARLTAAQRLRLEWSVAQDDHHLAAALLAAEQWVRERPNEWVAWNAMGITLYYLRGPEAMLEVLDSAAGLEAYATMHATVNRSLLLIHAGRRAEARQVARNVPRDSWRLGLQLVAAVLDGAWDEVERLGPAWDQAALARPSETADASAWRAIVHLVRGEVRAAMAERADAPGSKLSLLWELATGAPVTRAPDLASPDYRAPREEHPAVSRWTWEGAFRVALAGDTAAAWAALPALTTDSLDYRVQSGYWSASIAAAVAARRGDWAALVQHATPLLRDRPTVGPVIGPAIRWLVAHAYERQGRSDSAAALLGELLAPGRLDGGDYFPYGAAHSYLRQHLIVLLARLGRIDDASAHWERFQTTFTNPDPEYEYLIDEARAELEAARRRPVEESRGQAPSQRAWDTLPPGVPVVSPSSAPNHVAQVQARVATRRRDDAH